jgi:hypothetical protein
VPGGGPGDGGGQGGVGVRHLRSTVTRMQAMARRRDEARWGNEDAGDDEEDEAGSNNDEGRDKTW